MKLITWNINGVRAIADKGLTDIMSRLDGDIYCFQETKAHRQQVDDFLSQSPYQSYWSSAQKKGYSGVATFLKGSVDRVEFGLGESAFDLEGRVIVTDHKDFLLYNIYFPNGSQGPERHLYKMKFLERLNVHLKNKMNLGHSVIVVGDYNVAYLESDVYDPVGLSKVSGFLPEERSWFQDFLQLGFVDAVHYMNPNMKDKYSWWSYREMARQENKGWRIDHICVSKDLISKIVRAEILDQEFGSDHCPVMLELK